MTQQTRITLTRPGEAARIKCMLSYFELAAKRQLYQRLPDSYNSSSIPMMECGVMTFTATLGLIGGADVDLWLAAARREKLNFAIVAADPNLMAAAPGTWHAYIQEVTVNPAASTTVTLGLMPRDGSP